MKFVCQKWVPEGTEVLPDDDPVIDSQPREKYVVHHEKRDQAAAQAICEDEGMNLVSLHSTAERDEVKALLPGEWFWIGLQDRDTEGTWVWTDGSDNDWTQWNGGEPNNWGSGEDCVHYGHGTQMNDIGCSHAQKFICRDPATVPGLVTAEQPVVRNAEPRYKVHN